MVYYQTADERGISPTGFTREVANFAADKKKKKDLFKCCHN